MLTAAKQQPYTTVYHLPHEIMTFQTISIAERDFKAFFRFFNIIVIIKKSLQDTGTLAWILRFLNCSKAINFGYPYATTND